MTPALENERAAATGRVEDSEWLAFAYEVGAREREERAPLVGLHGKLDVLSSEWLAPEGDMHAVIELQVRTREGRVLNLDMALLLECVTDATSDYDEVDCELVEHQYDMSNPDEVDRFVGCQDNGERTSTGQTRRSLLKVIAEAGDTGWSLTDIAV